jgi:hypothetical protein
MTVSLADPKLSCEQPLGAETYDVMCMVKRHAYELAFAVPHASRAIACGAQPCMHIRVKTPCQAEGFVLTLENVARFYEDLLQMMEYLQREHQKLGTSKPL